MANAENRTEDFDSRVKYHEKNGTMTELGTVVYKVGLGYFIQPDSREYGVVNIINTVNKMLPEGLKVGDRVKFTRSRTNTDDAETYHKISD